MIKTINSLSVLFLLGFCSAHAQPISIPTDPAGKKVKKIKPQRQVKATKNAHGSEPVQELIAGIDADKVEPIIIPRESHLIQNKYQGVDGEDAALLSINGKLSQLVQFENYDSFMQQHEPVAGESSNEISKGGKKISVFPFIVVPDSEYPRYQGKDANHVRVNGKETIVFSASEINTSISSYPGIKGKPANHVVIDGVETVFIDEAEYRSYISRYEAQGIKDMPSNYLQVDGKTVIVIPVKDVKNKNLIENTSSRVSGASQPTPRGSTDSGEKTSEVSGGPSAPLAQ